MKRDGVTKLQSASAIVVALLIVGGLYILAQPSKSSPSSVTTSSSYGIGSGIAPSSSTNTGSNSSAASQVPIPGSSTSSALSSSSSLTSATSTITVSTNPKVSHVVVILMENEEYGSVIGSPDAPYETSLASTYASAGAYFAVAHPSLPNYLALVAGSTFGISSDCSPSQCGLPPGVTTIVSLLGSHGLSWKEYAESMPTNCSQTDSGDGLYVTKHDPFVYFGSITGNNGTGSTSSYCDAHVVALTQFYSDLSAGALPNFSFITPNICDDAHSCPLEDGDQWLSQFVPQIVSSSSFTSTAIFIVYDEGAENDTSGGGGQVPCILVSPFAKTGYVSQVEYSHYSLLATVEAIFNVGSLGRNDTSASPMSDLFKGGVP